MQLDLLKKPAVRHECHWPTCRKEVPPRLWGCKFHWLKLPMRIRAAIWAAYVPGQEIRKDPSPEYIEAARWAEAWISREIAAGREQ